MAGLSSQAFTEDAAPVRQMAQSGDPAYIPVLTELLRFQWSLYLTVRQDILSALDTLAGNPEDDIPALRRDWGWWVDWVGRHSEVEAPEGFASWKGDLFAKMVDPNMGAFLHDGVKSRIRIEEIVWGGVPKDGIPDLTNPPVVLGSQATYLNPSDRVFGVSIEGEHRAYPLRILNPHEMANDVLGGVPFSLAY